MPLVRVQPTGFAYESDPAMWDRRDCANALLAAVIFLIVGLLLFPPVGGHP